MIHSIIANYFDNPLCTKIRNDATGFSIYYTRIRCSSLDKRYLICVAPMDRDKAGTLKQLYSIQWISFMTRTLPEHFPLQEHAYTPKRGQPYNGRLLKTYSNEEETNYICESFPKLRVSILSPTASQSGTLQAALETYNTVLVVE